MISTEVPPNAWMSWLPVNENTMDGTVAMSARKMADGSVILLSTFLM